MNETLKHRIVGAIVITALAAIFVPMLFDDPVTDADNFTNELTLPQEPADDLQPLLDDIPKTSAQVLSRPMPAQVDLQAAVEDSPKVSEPQSKPTRAKQAPVQTQKQNKSTKPKPASQAAHLKSWVIQVGSFSQKKNAIEFRDKLRKNKFTAYVDSVKTNQGILYRLRVGPELGKNRALATKKKLEAKYKVKTLLVSE